MSKPTPEYQDSVSFHIRRPPHLGAIVITLVVFLPSAAQLLARV